jgi:hypothetical protein
LATAPFPVLLLLTPRTRGAAQGAWLAPEIRGHESVTETGHGPIGVRPRRDVGPPIS